MASNEGFYEPCWTYDEDNVPEEMVEQFVKKNLETPRHPDSARFHELIREIAALHDQKQKDYGRDNDPFANVRASEGWGIQPWVGALLRMSDKVKRLQAFANNGILHNESAEDSMRDIAVYALIALVLYEQTHDTEQTALEGMP